MKLLFDQNISFRVVTLLKDAFPQASHVKTFDLQFATDRQIWNFARDNNFHIVTFDSDFYDFATLYGHPPKIIWLRLGNTSSRNQVGVLARYSEAIQSFLTDEKYKDIACIEIY